jgi:23S rRNA (cytosine1962-C5)-methyltransferase
MSHLPKVHLKPSASEGIARRHPWIYRGAVAHSQGEMGDLVEVLLDRRPVAFGLLGPSDIAVRILGFGPAEDLGAVLSRRLASAASWRIPMARSRGVQAFRLVHGESDGLPAAVVDLYGSTAVLQLSHLGWIRNLDLFVRCLLEAVPSIRSVVLKNTGKHLPKEGLQEDVRVLIGSLDQDLTVPLGRVPQRVPVLKGQKTGLYLDTRDWAEDLSRLPLEGARVLDAFSYQGHLSLNLLALGAREAVLVEQSPLALSNTLWSARGLGLQERVTLLEGNAFDLLKGLDQRGEKFNLVIMDPPPFAPSRRNLEGAMRGYRELMVRAINLVLPGGFVLFGSCSHAVSHDALLELALKGALDRSAQVRVIHRPAQPWDHPVSPQVPQGEYLKGILMEVDK